MIKKSIFEDELIAGMQKRLAQPEVDEAMEYIVDAADLLNAAAEIFEDAGMIKEADKILNILAKIAIKHHQEKNNKNPVKTVDHATKGLTPEKMVKNLLHHGTEFNMAFDNNSADDLLNSDFDDKSLEVNEKDPLNHEMDFEDEI